MNLVYDQTIISSIPISHPESSGFLVSGQPQERLWGNGIVTAGILQLTVLSFVTVNSPEQPIKTPFFFPLPQSLSWLRPLTKKPEESGYEIGSIQTLLLR